MKISQISFVILSILTISCSSWNKTQKGAAVGTAGGAAAGAVIGKAAGNTVLGAIIGATVGGVTGAVIGRKMDKQAEELKKDIPDAKIDRVGEGIVIEFNSQILFDFDKYELTSDARTNLSKLVTILQKYPDTNIEIQGHTDNSGTKKYNNKLSKNRAKSVSKYLAATNISNSRLSIKGFGESEPKYSNNEKNGQAQNRRVEFLVSANEKMKNDSAKEATTSSNN
ncbi:MAG: OmpA family protein [Saprospiraceae bacterium]|nr:OmpA family protein [Saprospiraceae bacterium]MBK8483827.1 OmpA family protein [Saprospiraceae bacterium]MBK9221279.1 OmpA family protein [Saprospiraceae bacterium]MBK9721787.1 OmpA family protein [Saprospiraceae bacterium]MBK9728847.1 OmpA family protein [Saprospiraceae bacterium]